MAKPLNQAGLAQRRNFRLSPLEMLIVALIILGVLYLMTIWVNSLLNQGSTAKEVQSAPVPLAQLEQAIIATEKAAAKMISLEKAQEQSRAEVQDLKKSLSSGSGNKALALRVSSLEKKLAGAKAAARGESKAESALAAKIAELEKAAANNGKLAARVQELEKLAANEARLEKSLQALDKRLAANEGLPEKMASLEKQLARADKLAARIQALEQKPAGNPALAEKVRELEKRPAADPETEARLKTLEKSINSGGGHENRLRNLESGLVGLAQERGDVSRRLDRMEKSMAQMQRSPGSASGQLPAPALPADSTDELARKRIAALTREVGELKAELEKLKAAPPRPAPAKPAKPAASAAPEPPRPQPEKPKAMAAPEPAPGQTKLFHYKVRRGDTLYGLARKYQVKISDLRRWNPKLQGRKYLWVGESLILYR